MCVSVCVYVHVCMSLCVCDCLYCFDTADGKLQEQVDSFRKEITRLEYQNNELDKVNSCMVYLERQICKDISGLPNSRMFKKFMREK